LVKNEEVVNSDHVSESDSEDSIRGSVTKRPFSTKISGDDMKSMRSSITNISISNRNDKISGKTMESFNTRDIVSVVANTVYEVETAPLPVVDAVQIGRKSRRFSKFLPQIDNSLVDNTQVDLPVETNNLVEPETATPTVGSTNESRGEDNVVRENKAMDISVSYNSKRESVRASPLGIKSLKEKYLATGTDGSVIVVNSNIPASSSITVPRRSTYLLSNESSNSNNTSSEEHKSGNTTITHSIRPVDSEVLDSSGNYKIYSYDVLVERNKLKMYDGLCQSDLELHLDDTEFLTKFGLSKEEYSKLPKWRKIAQKKALLLF